MDQPIWARLPYVNKVIDRFFPGAYSLQKRFIIVASVALFALIVIVSCIIIKRELRFMYSNIERQGRLLAKVLAIPITDALKYKKVGIMPLEGLIDKYVGEVFGETDIDLIYLAVLDEKGRVIAHNDFNRTGMDFHNLLTEKAVASKSTIVYKIYDERVGNDVLDFGAPLYAGVKRLGTLKYALSLRKVDNEVKAAVLKVLLVSALFLIGVVSIIMFLNRRFIKPVTELADTIENADSDIFDIEVDIKASDELVLLGQSFNRMMRRIRESNNELKHAHDKFLQSQKLASIGVLTAGVAHEINNPLGGMFNCLEILNTKEGSIEFRKRYLDLIEDGLGRIENTVGKLLWMSRKSERKPQVVEIKQVLEDVYGFIEYRLKNSNITYSEQIEGGLCVFMDPHDLMQVLINLEINAIQSMNNGGGSLRINAFRKNSSVALEVSDTGEGIDEITQDKIFDPFFTTKQPGEGTGLGLWLTYEIVKNYNGDVSMTSEKGKGSTFVVKLDIV